MAENINKKHCTEVEMDQFTNALEGRPPNPMSPEDQDAKRRRALKDSVFALLRDDGILTPNDRRALRQTDRSLYKTFSGVSIVDVPHLANELSLVTELSKVQGDMNGADYLVLDELVKLIQLQKSKFCIPLPGYTQGFQRPARFQPVRLEILFRDDSDRSTDRHGNVVGGIPRVPTTLPEYIKSGLFICVQGPTCGWNHYWCWNFSYKMDNFAASEMSLARSLQHYFPNLTDLDLSLRKSIDKIKRHMDLAAGLPPSCSMHEDPFPTMWKPRPAHFDSRFSHILLQDLRNRLNLSVDDDDDRVELGNPMGLQGGKKKK